MANITSNPPDGISPLDLLSFTDGFTTASLVLTSLGMILQLVNTAYAAHTIYLARSKTALVPMWSLATMVIGSIAYLPLLVAQAEEDGGSSSLQSVFRFSFGLASYSHLLLLAHLLHMAVPAPIPTHKHTTTAIKYTVLGMTTTLFLIFCVFATIILPLLGPSDLPLLANLSTVWSLLALCAEMALLLVLMYNTSPPRAARQRVLIAVLGSFVAGCGILTLDLTALCVFEGLPLQGFIYHLAQCFYPCTFLGSLVLISNREQGTSMPAEYSIKGRSSICLPDFGVEEVEGDQGDEDRKSVMSFMYPWGNETLNEQKDSHRGTGGRTLTDVSSGTKGRPNAYRSLYSKANHRLEGEKSLFDHCA